MKTKQEIFTILSSQLDNLKSEYGVRELGVFGSTVREEHSSDSDIDILVEFSRSIGLVGFLRLENSLQNLLDTKVDLVTRKALKKRIGKRILQEVQYVN